MIKKLVTTGAAAGLLLASAVPAFATLSFPFGSDDLNVNQGNWGVVNNNVVANSNTGNQAKLGGNFALGTGDAATLVGVVNGVNGNSVEVKGCDCFDDVTVNQHNGALVNNNVVANANSGNQAGGWFGGNNKALFTANAVTGVAVDNLVNTNFVKVN